MANLIISYPKQDGAHFDADYYRDTHMPLVERAWGGNGLTGAKAMFPVDDKQPFAAVAILEFRDGASIDATMASPGTAEVVGDVANFTNIKSTVFRSD